MDFVSSINRNNEKIIKSSASLKIVCVPLYPNPLKCLLYPSVICWLIYSISAVCITLCELFLAHKYALEHVEMRCFIIHLRDCILKSIWDVCGAIIIFERMDSSICAIMYWQLHLKSSWYICCLFRQVHSVVKGSIYPWWFVTRVWYIL